MLSEQMATRRAVKFPSPQGAAAVPPNALLLPRARTRHHTRRRRPRAHLYRQAATARTHSPPTATAQRPSPAPPGRPVPVPSLPPVAAAAAAFVLCAARPARLTKQSLSAGAGRTMQQDLRNSDRRNPEQAYPVMSASSTNSAASPAVSGLDYDDTALTLALPGSSAEPAADRKRAHADHDKPPSPKYAP
jgi:hypothetical protein